MKDYVKPTIEILEKQIEKSIADTNNNEIEGIYKFLPIHTLSKKNNRAYVDAGHTY